ncbi:replication endonuclease [Chromobacterium phragmitis]|uniref:replication endonuclease n=1 Tax=Chromobacterium amazonense TaxID=1382803 RepID=UPI0021B7C924|nr:replication endonuclease [Chromobacterium amazonense]MBM2883868.1 replication endonuclease [Chromobacterium amazonense]MDE1716494.1 replication endonuclease [Chromobacterium amazonense]
MNIHSLLIPNSAYLKPRLQGLPSALADSISDEWKARLARPETPASWLRSADANAWLNFTTEAIREIGMPRRLLLDENDILEKAKALARRSSWLRRCGATLADVEALAGLYHLHLPDWTRQPHSPESVWTRAADPSFWRRQIRTVHGRLAERGARLAGRVHNRAGLYASDDAVRRKRARKRRNNELLSTLLVVNELGQEFSLADLAAVSPSNPIIRRAELMVRLRGFETYAKEHGHACDFYTLTCPGSYHARLSKSGAPNPNYDPKIGPREAQAHLQRVWSRARSKLHRKGIRVYGFRVAEPHHDGTPHWHMVMFFDEADRKEIRRILRHYALQVDPTEKGAWRRRFTFKRIDMVRGSACGYVAKYIAKNVDGRAASGGDLPDYDGESNPSNPARFCETALRVEAWAGWGIRQFQQIGCVPVTVWRELRRLDADEVRSELAPLVRAADGSDWAEFVRLQGGAQVKRGDLLCRPYREPITNRYGEESAIVRGVELQLGQHPTLNVPMTDITISRVHTWTITTQGGVSDARGAGAERALRGGDSRPWTRVNNCTQHEIRMPGRASFRESLMDEIESRNPPDVDFPSSDSRWIH